MGKQRGLATACRVVVSGLMLGYLSWRIKDAGLDLPDWTFSTFAWITGAALFTLLGIVLSALRWQAVLHVLGQRSGIRRLLSYYLAGQFVANVLPTTIGGDVLRVSRLSRETGESPTSFASVVLERLTGWLVLPVMTFIGLALNPGLRHLGRATQIAVALAGCTLVMLTLVIVGVASHRVKGELEDLTGWRRFLAAVRIGIDQFREHPATALNVVAVGFLYQTVLVLAAVMAARAVGIPAAGPTALLAFFPAVLIGQALPISISGLGVREGLFVLFLQPLDVPSEQAIALGLLLYVLNLVVSLLGAPAFAVGNRSRRTIA
jgi:glycosyltransferase 2 family protein